jgi:hypothetical protein
MAFGLALAGSFWRLRLVLRLLGRPRGEIDVERIHQERAVPGQRR